MNPLPRFRRLSLKFRSTPTHEPQAALREIPGPTHPLIVVSDFSTLAAMHPDWDRFIDSFAPSPLFLMGSLETHFRRADEGGRSFAVVMNEGGRPIGLAIFRIADSHVPRRPGIFRFRGVEFLFPDYWFSDFVVGPEHRNEFVEGVLSLLFDTLRYQSARLTLPSNSPSAPVLRKWCQGRGMVVRSFPSDRYSVLRVNGTWDDYFASREKTYVDNYKRSVRKLNRAGRWEVFSGRIEMQAVVDKIMEVDRNSWKQEWRRRRGEGDDKELVRILEYYRHAPGGRFCPLFWLLELEGKPIAFSVATVLGGVAYVFKSSYDARYRYFAPGVVLQMRAFRDLFESGIVSQMNFFTSYDYMRPWRPEILRRETFVIENYRGPLKLFLRLRRTRYAARVWRSFFIRGNKVTN